MRACLSTEAQQRWPDACGPVRDNSQAVPAATAEASLGEQMKAMFKRWLDFEMERGTPAQAQHVQSAAQAYVEQHLAG